VKPDAARLEQLEGDYLARVFGLAELERAPGAPAAALEPLAGAAPGAPGAREGDEPFINSAALERRTR
jgi:hypothetical protein